MSIPLQRGLSTGPYDSPERSRREKPIDMSGDPACVEAHHGKAYDESLVVNPNGTLANVFVYIKSGLEGKKFEDTRHAGDHRPARLLVSSAGHGHTDRPDARR